MRRTCFLVIIGLLSVFGSPIFADDAANATSREKRIVVLGDSITAGYGLSQEEAYPAVLQGKVDAAELPFKVINAGVSGDTTAGGLRRVAWAMAKGADILIIALGGNDGLRGISPEETRKNLLGIIKKARAKNSKIDIFVAGMEMPDNMGADYTSKFREVFSAVSTETKTRLIPFLLDGVGGNDELNQKDRIHPTAAGQKKIAENIWVKLAPALNS